MDALPTVSDELPNILMIIARWVVAYRTKMFSEAVQGLGLIESVKFRKGKHFGRTLVFGRLVRCRTIDERCRGVAVVRIDQGNYLSELDGFGGCPQSLDKGSDVVHEALPLGCLVV